MSIMLYRLHITFSETVCIVYMYVASSWSDAIQETAGCCYLFIKEPITAEGGIYITKMLAVR